MVRIPKKRSRKYWQAGVLFVSILFSQFSFLSAQAHAQTKAPEKEKKEKAKIEMVSSSFDCVFTRSLSFGARGEDVRCLQESLMLHGYFVFAGGSTGYFGSITRSAVARWQADNGITPSVGYFGPLSTAKYRLLSPMFSSKTDQSPKTGQSAQKESEIAENAKKSEIAVKTNDAVSFDFSVKVPPAIKIPESVLLPAAKELSLPEIQDSEIIIDDNGISTYRDYLYYLSVNGASSTPFDGKKFAVALTDKQNIPLSPFVVFEKALGDGDFSAIQPTLAVYKEFLEAKIASVKKIKVADDAVSLHKKIIAHDKLTIEVIGMARDVSIGKITKKEFTDFYWKYKFLTKAEGLAVQKKINGSSLARQKEQREGDLFGRIMEKFGLINSAYALFPFDFGAKLTFAIPCLCSLSIIAYGFDGATAPRKKTGDGKLMVSFFQFFTPIGFRMWWSFVPGVFWLGTYIPGAYYPCYVLWLFPPSCIYIDEAELILQAGTQGLPSGGLGF